MTPEVAILTAFTFAALVAICVAASGSTEGNWAKPALGALFPVSTTGSAEAYVDGYEKHHEGEPPERTKFIDQREASFENLRLRVSQAAEKEILKELRDIALARTKSEDDRQSSVMTRAQALLIGIAVLGAVLTLAGTLSSAAVKAAGQTAAMASALIAAYVIIMVVLMTFNVLRAVSGLSYTAAGNSDFARWVASADVAAFYRAHTLMALDHLRRAKLNNDWRFWHLHLAQTGVRNITYALSLMAVTVLVFSVLPKMP